MSVSGDPNVRPGLTSTLPQRYTNAIITMAAKTSKPRKTKGILIRVTEAQKRVLAKTAKSTGLGLSSWMLSIALQAAQKMKRPQPQR